MAQMELHTGILGRQEDVVTSDKLATGVGSGKVKVLATVMMIALMEKTALLSVEPYLAEGQGTVGTRVDVSHCSSTPLGMKFHVESELIEIDRRRLVFRVAAYDECGLIGEGTHERFIIDYERFQSKTDNKSSKKI
ncbi:MAG: thioesterase family protein [Bacteroidales bacterium]|nr:thioesterase family protein [Candidatus Cryptobacteroides aphodequi]